MTPSPHPETAKIYAFPARERSTLPFDQRPNSNQPATKAATPLLASSSWYHQAAIDEAGKPRLP